MTNRLRATWLCTAAFVLTLAIPGIASAQGFVSPFIGYDFSGDSGCPELAGCEDKNLNFGVGFGTMGSILGFEMDFGYAKDFFGESADYSSSVLTFTGNVLLGPQIGPVRPYGAAGLGLIKTNVDFTTLGLLETDNNHFGWDLGGGLMIFFGETVGIRGDIRHFHAFQDLSLLGLTIGDTKLDFGRASGSLVFRF
jgi:opacity protein-like surface antigen